MLAPVTIRIDTEVEGLWNSFNEITTEMVICKAGRKPYPNFDFQVGGLEPEKKYCILMKMEDIDKKRYSRKSSWMGVPERKLDKCEDIVLHKKGIQSGEEWMQNFISFDNVKFTNCENHGKDHMFFLQSMHKYRPHLEVYSMLETEPQVISIVKFKENKEKVMVYSRGFEMMDFIAVTRYQNEKVTALKIETNRFASGFRGKKDTEKQINKNNQMPVSMGVPHGFNPMHHQVQNNFNSNTGFNQMNYNPSLMNQQMMMAYMMKQWKLQQTMPNQYQNMQLPPPNQPQYSQFQQMVTPNNYNTSPLSMNFNMNYPTPVMTPQTTPNTPVQQYQSNGADSGPANNVPVQSVPTPGRFSTPDLSRPNSGQNGAEKSIEGQTLNSLNFSSLNQPSFINNTPQFINWSNSHNGPPTFNQ